MPSWSRWKTTSPEYGWQNKCRTDPARKQLPEPQCVARHPDFPSQGGWMHEFWASCNINCWKWRPCPGSCHPASSATGWDADTWSRGSSAIGMWNYPRRRKLLVKAKSLLQCRKNISLQNGWWPIFWFQYPLNAMAFLLLKHPYLWGFHSTTWIFGQFHPSPPSITTPMKSFQFSLIALASPAPLLPWSACNCRWFSVRTESSTLAQNDSAWFSMIQHDSAVLDSFGW